MNWINTPYVPSPDNRSSRVAEDPDNLWDEMRRYAATMLFHREVSDIPERPAPLWSPTWAINPRELFKSVVERRHFTEVKVPAPTPDPLPFSANQNRKP